MIGWKRAEWRSEEEWKETRRERVREVQMKVGDVFGVGCRWVLELSSERWREGRREDRTP